MTFREVTELKERSRNAAHTSAIMYSGNGWLEPTGSPPVMDRRRRRIVAREALRAEMDDKRWIPSGDESSPDVDRDRLWIDDRRWITGDGWQSMPFPCMMILRLREIIPSPRQH
jgi:hypothetical protein